MPTGYLVHYGIDGQKWGIRRFENEDGTLTPAGKRRYRKYRHINREDLETQATRIASTRYRTRKGLRIGVGSIAGLGVLAGGAAAAAMRKPVAALVIAGSVSAAGVLSVIGMRHVNKTATSEGRILARAALDKHGKQAMGTRAISGLAYEFNPKEAKRMDRRYQRSAKLEATE